MIDKNAIDPNALNYFRMLKKAGYAAYFVGGSVRDLLLGKTPKDFDIATNATPNQIKRVIPQGKIIGRRFRHVMLEKDGGRYEIVTFRGPVVESAEPEPAENEEFANRKRYPDLNQFGNAEQDATRRDFTINALFYDPDADELVDYVGGKKDIDERVVRTIGDALVRLKDDPIRILRAIRHKMKLDLEYSPELKTAIFEASPDLENTSKDRIREEFLKVCIDRSLCSFLEESRKMKVSAYVAPWFEELSEEGWQEAVKLWQAFRLVDAEQDLPAEVGLSLMFAPLVKEVILKAFEERIPKERREGGMLPDIKFFLGSEKLRNWLLRNLRISKIQTDTVLRACFYCTRMTGHWLDEGGPPKRIEGKLRHQPGALIGAYMAKVWLVANEREVPAWIQELALGLWESPAQHRGRGDRLGQREERDNRDRRDQADRLEQGAREHRRDESRRDRGERGERADRGERERGERNERREREAEPAWSDDQPYRAPNALPILDKPLVWNGPLHAPALRPIFHEESSANWQTEGQSAGYRPSGIPSAPVDRAFLSAKVTNNYKPEFTSTEESGAGSQEDRPQRERGGRRDRDQRRGGRDRSRQPQRAAEAESASESQNPDQETEFPAEAQGDDIGYAAGDSHEAHADALVQQPGYTPYDDEDPDDNIGNRIDGPPTSGYVGDETVDTGDPNDYLTSHARQMRHQQRHGGNGNGPGGGGGGRRRRRRGGRNRRGGRGGGASNAPQGGGGRRSPNFRETT